MDTDQSSNMLSTIQSEVAKYQMLIEEENQKLKRYKVCSLCFSDESVGKVVRNFYIRFCIWEAVAVNLEKLHGYWKDKATLHSECEG